MEDGHHSIFAQLKPSGNLLVRVALCSEAENPIGIPIGLDSHARLPTEVHALSCAAAIPERTHSHSRSRLNSARAAISDENIFPCGDFRSNYNPVWAVTETRQGSSS